MVIFKELDQITHRNTNPSKVVDQNQDNEKWVNAKFEEVTAILPEKLKRVFRIIAKLNEIQ